MAVRQRNLQEIISLHRQRYPLMEPVDYGKLLYQNEFGPEHMIHSPEAVEEWIVREWRECATSFPRQNDFGETRVRDTCGEGTSVEGTHGKEPRIEDIGNRLYRFHLTDGYDIPLAAPLLARLFYRTAGAHRGTKEGLSRKLALLKELGVPRMESWLEEYIRTGCPALGHSGAFRQAYAPHYRLLRDEYAIYFPVIYRVEKSLAQSGHAVIAIDGPCGGGKSSLAALLSDLFPSRVLHMDDYYLPLERRAPGWEHTPCGNMDLDRFRRQALLPAADHMPIICRPYSCREGRLLPPETLPAAPLTIVEGSYSLHPLLAPHIDLKIFLRCDSREQLSRLCRRENTRPDAYLQRWIPLEQAYYRAFDIPAQCDLTFDNTEYFT